MNDNRTEYRVTAHDNRPPEYRQGFYVKAPTPEEAVSAFFTAFPDTSVVDVQRWKEPDGSPSWGIPKHTTYTVVKVLSIVKVGSE